MKIKITYKDEEYFVNTDNITKLKLDVTPDFPSGHTDLVELKIFNGSNSCVILSENTWKRGSKLVEMHKKLRRIMAREYSNYEQLI